MLSVVDNSVSFAAKLVSFRTDIFLLENKQNNENKEEKGTHLVGGRR